MEDLSEDRIVNDCPHCDPDSFALASKLKETDNFWVTCDVHPLIEGHILIIPRSHVSCTGEFSDDLFAEFSELFHEVASFLKEQYGSVSTFEHGKTGQTVYHAHAHLLPYTGAPESIVPEKNVLNPVSGVDALKDVFEKDDQYLFFSIGEKAWTVDTKIGAPRFFRTRFGEAVGNPERANWREMHADDALMDTANQEIERLVSTWKEKIGS